MKCVCEVVVSEEAKFWNPSCRFHWRDSRICRDRDIALYSPLPKALVKKLIAARLQQIKPKQ